MNETSLHLTCVVPSPVQRVFAAWTDPELMARWFFVEEAWTAEVENDLRVGGAFSIVMHASQDQTFECTGVYLEIEPPRRLVFTWTSYAARDTRVTVELQDLGDQRTELTLTHENLVELDVRNNHAEGWGGCLASLERFLSIPR
jgi:uncharacterized protein YndB with AHSA1/START domain